jgi:predicted RNase H-like HicB family nuclease
MAKEYTVVVERDSEGLYVASVPQLTGCHTQARSLDELMERVKEAIAATVDGEADIPELEFVGLNCASIGFRHRKGDHLWPRGGLPAVRSKAAASN